jgi:hypothetical protein
MSKELITGPILTHKADSCTQPYFCNIHLYRILPFTFMFLKSSLLIKIYTILISVTCAT